MEKPGETLILVDLIYHANGQLTSIHLQKFTRGQSFEQVRRRTGIAD